MQRPTSQQIQQFLDQGTNILLALPQQPSIDALGAAYALTHYLKHIKKDVTVLTGQLSDTHRALLPRLQDIRTDLGGCGAFVIHVNLAHAKVETLSYDIRDGILAITLQPKQGAFAQDDVTVPKQKPAYDLIVTLDCPEIEALGAPFNTQSEFFYQTPILNIDHHATNTRYGSLNYIDPSAIATSEILLQLLTSWNAELIVEHIATGLLAGLIEQTKNFQTNTVTPNALRSAGDLVTRGAARESIVKHLYRTKTIEMLRLWGRALSTLTSHYQEKVITARLALPEAHTPEDVLAHLDRLLDEIVADTPALEVLAFFFLSSRGSAESLIHAPETIAVDRILAALHPERHGKHYHVIHPTTDLAEAEKRFLELLAPHYAKSPPTTIK